MSKVDNTFCGTELPTIPFVTKNFLKLHGRILTIFHPLSKDSHPLREMIVRIASLAAAIVVYPVLGLLLITAKNGSPKTKPADPKHTSQDLLFCVRVGVASTGSVVENLIKASLPEPQHKMVPFKININGMPDLVREQEHKISVTNPPVAIFYDDYTTYGRVDDFLQWNPLFNKCHAVAIIHLLDPESPGYKSYESQMGFSPSASTTDKRQVIEKHLCDVWKKGIEKGFEEDALKRDFKYKVINIDVNQRSLTSQQTSDLQILCK